MPRAVHHLELWVSDLARSSNEWEWLLGELGWESEVSGDDALSWVHPDGTHLVMESSVDRVDAPDDRPRSGVRQLALTVEDRGLLDRIRGASTEHGWHELFADRYPHAGGDRRTALYLESSEGFEVELVVEVG
jgi:catechol 2,3-dioxygenase-like lactoylglutathione lyase family enzyme